jgi:hypothetical protein
LIHPSLVFRSLSETSSGSNRFPSHILLKTVGDLVQETSSLRLFAPSTLTGTRSLRLPGFASPRTLRFQGFYPLNAFLLLEPLNRVSGPSVLGVNLFRVFFPSKSRTSFEALCSPALFLSRRSRSNENSTDFRALLPLKSATRRPSFYMDRGATTLLRFPSLRHPLVPAYPFGFAPLLRFFSLTRRERTRRSRVFLTRF